ncbi:hypothetical protein BcepSauron_393 [Burkholderia phage BcepSauron]|uniref:Uncharacterized protein n=1 Tax=Burkholderia phage BcepSauron TaxID=2530033 RepID=A0A482MNK0_9CAUD|nr:hypothetical protein H1O17_gp393 [Burkholderia phage BcepSauron]QBQ74773.1 hypothetical protein BcepSauron_393 [Burkholderia phage BcepSauron]
MSETQEVDDIVEAHAVKNYARLLLVCARLRIVRKQSSMICFALANVAEEHSTIVEQKVNADTITVEDGAAALEYIGLAHKKLATRIRQELGGASSLDSWLQMRHGIPYGTGHSSVEARRATRIAWMDFMLENWV